MDGNWITLVKEYEPLTGRLYLNDGFLYKFFGLVHGDDDYYYGMSRVSDGQVRLLSCVGSPEGFGYKVKNNDSL